MQTTNSISSLEDRIAIIRDNIRQLVEQAAAALGGGVTKNLLQTE